MECEKYLGNSRVDRNIILSNTQTQSEEEWYKIRRQRLTTSYFRKLCTKRESTDAINIIRSILYSSNVLTKEIE